MEKNIYNQTSSSGPASRQQSPSGAYGATSQSLRFYYRSADAPVVISKKVIPLPQSSMRNASPVSGPHSGSNTSNNSTSRPTYTLNIPRNTTAAPISKIDAAINNLKTKYSSNTSANNLTVASSSFSTMSSKSSSNSTPKNNQPIIRSSPSLCVASSSEGRPAINNQIKHVEIGRRMEAQANPVSTPGPRVPSVTPTVNIAVNTNDVPQGSQLNGQKRTFNLFRSNIKVTPKRNINTPITGIVSQGTSRNDSQLVINRSSKPNEISSNESSNLESPSSLVSVLSTKQNAKTNGSPISSSSVEKSMGTSTPQTSLRIDINSNGSNVGSKIQTASNNGSPKNHFGAKHHPTNSSKFKQNTTNIPFIWDDYLKATGSVAAPIECFKQNRGDLTCKFEINMKLETRDPRNMSAWCLATIIRREGIRIQLRLDGSGNSNDFWQLINSADIRPVGTIADGDKNRLAPPVGFTSCCSSYAKWIEKRITKPGVFLAPDNCFEPEPEAPPNNLFKRGMKLEAVDKKNTYLICPATVGKILGDEVSIEFDGWKGSFDYRCPYYSRDIYPVGWCHRTGYSLQKPGNWPSLLDMLPGFVEPQTEMKEELELRGASTFHENVKKKKISFQEPIEEFANAFSCRRTTPISDWNLTTKSGKVKAPASLDTQATNPKLNPNFSPVPNPSFRLIPDASFKPVADPIFKPVTDSSFKPAPDSSFKPVADTSFTTVPNPGLNTYPNPPKFSSASSQTLTEKRKRGRPKNINGPKKKFKHSNGVKKMKSATLQLASEELSAPSMQHNLKPVEPSIDYSIESEIIEEMFIPANKQPQTPIKKNVSSFNVEDVITYILKKDDILAKHANTFIENEIDGKSFMLLTQDCMSKDLGLKLGPILKIKHLQKELENTDNLISLN